MRIKSIIFLLLVFILAISFYQKEKLPSNENVIEDLYQEPIQRVTDRDPFEIEKEGIAYEIDPLYEYELYGMIVSYHHSKSWFDYYHQKWSDFINVKDICVIWGNNIESGIYQSMKFKNGSWTCYWQSKDNTSWSQFQDNALSNNHLLTDKEEVSKAIMEAKKGDQIYLKGYLVQYSHSNDSFKRGTSITRDDRGNGACETIYVTDFKILKKANFYWNFLYSSAKYLIVAYIILYLIYIIFWPQRKIL